MFESLESRQFFSITVGTEPTLDTAPAPAITVDAAEAKKPKPKPAASTPQTYMVLTLENVFITG